MASGLKNFAAWVFDKPLRSSALHSVARAYCRVYKDGLWDKADSHTNGEFRLLRRVAPTLSTAFDVGANVGDWTGELIAANPSVTVHAFEPVAATRDVFQRNNFAENVRLNPYGLSDKSGTLEIYNYGGDGGMNSVYRRTDLEDKNTQLKPTVEEIQLQTLDEYAAREGVERVDFMKIDVEGHELSVLKGASRMISEDRVRIVTIEYGTSFHMANTLLRDIFDALPGMAGGLIQPTGVEKHEQYSTRLETFGFSNWVFAKPDDSIVWG